MSKTREVAYGISFLARGSTDPFQDESSQPASAIQIWGARNELLGRPGVPTPAGGCSEGPAPGRLRPEASLRSNAERAVSRGVQGLETLHWPGDPKSGAEGRLRCWEDCWECVQKMPSRAVVHLIWLPPERDVPHSTPALSLRCCRKPERGTRRTL
jgi:hypothetical protein